VLSRHIKPAGRKLGIGGVNWQVLRRSCATWMDQAQVNVKDAQGLMRHSRASTTQDVYQQVVPEAQRKAVRKVTAFVRASVKVAVVVQ
jgi:integrase